MLQIYFMITVIIIIITTIIIITNVIITTIIIIITTVIIIIIIFLFVWCTWWWRWCGGRDICRWNKINNMGFIKISAWSKLSAVQRSNPVLWMREKKSHAEWPV